MSTNCATKPFKASVGLHYIAANTDDTTKCWNSPGDSESSAASLTEDDPSGCTTEVSANVQSKIISLKCKFHRDRKLLVKHLPRNVVKQEIAQLLNDFAIDFIHLSSNDDKSSTATVTLENPEVLDEWNSERTFLLRGQSVSVSPTPTEMVLCVAKLPFCYTESDFHDLIKGFGDVKMYFLMISEKTGASKGYGFVQYTNKESALSARNALNDKMVDSFHLVCDWLDSSRLTFKSLHSTCLYVDHLPRQFRDMGEFRAIFSKIVKPPYCQIALRNGCPLDWGLVEYLSPEDAELGQTSCNGFRLRNQPIRVVFFIPGVRAITVMMNLLEMPSRGKSMGLLPDPTGQSIRMSIENLSKQNPIFAENLKNIILHQIQESKHVKDGREESKSAPKMTEPKTLDIGLKHQKDIEKIIPPTPPMTPTIINTLPIISPAGGVPAPILPNTAVPPPAAPPCLEKLAYTQPSLAIGAKEKYAVMWNDLLGHPQFTGNFVPTIQPATPDPATAAAVATANAAFAVRPSPAITPLGANFAQEILNLPLNVQQSILNIINNSSVVPSVTAVQPAAHPTAAQSVAFSPLASVDPTTNWFLQQKPTTVEGPTLVSTPLGPSIVTMPVVSKAMLPNWSSVASFMPTPGGIPIFTSAGAEWPGMRMHHQVVVSQPSTPISHHPVHHQIHHYMAGQKRKLLPSPEKSPEGNYIGQHSQGIGGHYADSYFKKKKMF